MQIVCGEVREELISCKNLVFIYVKFKNKKKSKFIFLHFQVSKRSGYPLRPEFVESLYYIYRATGDPIILHLAANIIELCA